MDSGSFGWGGVTPKQAPARRHVVNNTGRDIWAVVRNGTVHDVEMALAHLKKINGNIGARNAFGSPALHVAVWRNHIPIVRRLLAAGADPNARDGESGWSSLHRALHFGHIAVAGVLIEGGGSLVLEDTKGRTPVDLISAPVKQSLASSRISGGKEVFSWGNGSNYQLGIGSTGILRVPGRVDALQGLDVIAVAAAKFHSVALSGSGEVYSWGFGRGGRLGHPDFDIHSGQVAVITPRKISHSFGCQGVSVIAVAKHHTVVATNGGEVYTWGSNREGRLGYPSVDTQPTPRRVSTLKVRVVAVAAANKHSAVLTEAGEVYTWGCNTEGQLGYGTSTSVSNYTPRVVESLKGKKLVSVSTAKHHTVVLGTEGEVLTWGYKMVNPRRISVVRYSKKAGSLPLKFHIADRLHVVAISAGMTHSLALSEDGLLFYWFSGDPQLRCHQLLFLAGHQAVTVSSSKYRTAVATSAGDVYSWDGKNAKADTIPVPLCVHGIKNATELSVGENHSVVVAAFFIPEYPLSMVPGTVTSMQSVPKGDDADVDPELEDDGSGVEVSSPKARQLGMDGVLKTLPSLKDLCQRVAAQSILEPKNALKVLEFADSLGADILRSYCEELVLRNLDYILTRAPFLFGHVRPSLLARVEKALDACSTQPWSHRRLPTPSATLPAIVDSEEEDNGLGGNASIRAVTKESSVFGTSSDRRMSEGFLLQTTDNGDTILRQVRALRKKLQQIEALEFKRAKGLLLDDQQLGKLQTKQALERVLSSLESGFIREPKKKVQKQEMKYGTDATDKSLSVGENPKRRTGGSKQPRRLQKKRSKWHTVAITQYPVTVATYAADSSGSRTAETLLLERSSFVGVGQESLATRNSNFVTISGFTSQGSTLERLDQAVSDVGRETLKGCSSLPNEPSDVPRTGTIPGPVLLPEQPPLPRKMITLGKKVVKGGLSGFLSGALDEPPKPFVPLPAPETPKVDGPAWGGAHVPKETNSLRVIQSEQRTEPKLAFAHAMKVGSGSLSIGERGIPSSKQAASMKEVAIAKEADKGQVVVDDTESNKQCVPLSQFVRTSPIAVVNNRSSSSVHPENNPRPWAAATSMAALSLRDIQLEQVNSKLHQRPSHSRGSPRPPSPVGVPTLLAGVSSSEYNVNSVETPNRWYKPEVNSPSNLHCIQIEEKAMKELLQLYKNVKLVRNDGR